MNKQVIATLTGVSKKYGKTTALDGIDLTINRGEVMAVLGPNGAGKTTLINLLLGRLSVGGGQVSVFGEQPGSLAAKRQIGAMLQVASLPDTLKVKEHIKLFQSYYPAPMAYRQIIDYAGLGDIENKLSRDLSGGQRQRLLFALAICGNPQLLFLDEPSVGMDIEARRGLWQAIRDLQASGTTVILTTHYLEEADALSDQIVMINQGKVVAQGTPQSIKAHVATKVIRFASNAAVDSLSTIADVSQIKTSGKYYELQSSNPVNTLKSLLVKLSDIDDLTISGAALEDAFMTLTEQQGA
jgi:ABC-2 type transport system ATP-binding protein